MPGDTEASRSAHHLNVIRTRRHTSIRGTTALDESAQAWQGGGERVSNSQRMPNFPDPDPSFGKQDRAQQEQQAAPLGCGARSNGERTSSPNDTTADAVEEGKEWAGGGVPRPAMMTG